MKFLDKLRVRFRIFNVARKLKKVDLRHEWIVPKDAKIYKVIQK